MHNKWYPDSDIANQMSGQINEPYSILSEYYKIINLFGLLLC